MTTCPLLIFLQGGPGGAGPRLNSPTSDGWIEEAIRHFRVILPDQRGHRPLLARGHARHGPHRRRARR